MIQKPRVELTPEQIREQTERSGLRPFAVHIIDQYTHTPVDYLVFAVSAEHAIIEARLHGEHVPGSAGQALPVDTAFIYGKIPQVARLI
jgi:hypothetical protein